jgi:hypothetical protein
MRRPRLSMYEVVAPEEEEEGGGGEEEEECNKETEITYC